jgi:hypothetical protein
MEGAIALIYRYGKEANKLIPGNSTHKEYQS